MPCRKSERQIPSGQILTSSFDTMADNMFLSASLPLVYLNIGDTLPWPQEFLLQISVLNGVTKGSRNDLEGPVNCHLVILI